MGRSHLAIVTSSIHRPKDYAARGAREFRNACGVSVTVDTAGQLLPRYSSRAGRYIIAACVLGSGITSLDATIVGLALPTIGRDFHANIQDLQWVVTGYMLTLAALLLLGGALGDRYGRKRIFMIGVVWFALASAACGFAVNAPMLIVTRILQGIGGALLTPGSLAILEASFGPGDRERAIGAWSGMTGLATAAGPFIGGYLISAASWRWIFFINVPISAFVVVLTLRHVPESSDPSARGRIDILGAVLAMWWLAALTYALIEGPARGWTAPVVIVGLVFAVLLPPIFVVVERRAKAPMLPLSLFSSRQFSAVNGVTFVVYAAIGGALFLLPVALQVVSGYSPLESGIALLPVTVIMLVLSAPSGRLAARIGPRLQMTVGPIVVGAGLALLSLAADGRNYWTNVLPAVLVFGFGLAITVAPLTATAMSSAPPERSGIASAVNNSVARLAGLIAVAVLPVVAGISGSSYLDPGAMASGFRTVVWIAAGAAALGGLLSFAGVRNVKAAGALRELHASESYLARHRCELDAPCLAQIGGQSGKAPAAPASTPAAS
jgi:EmrB/QacA subfamily drug resistance transporter